MKEESHVRRRRRAAGEARRPKHPERFAGGPGRGRVPVHPDRQLRGIVAPARGLAPGEHLPGQQAPGRAGRRRRPLHAGADVRQADGPGRRRRPAGAGHAQGGLVLPQRAGHRRRGSSPPAGTTPASCRAPPRHRRHRRPRTRLGGRGAVGGEHPLLVPLYAAPRLQLRAAVAAAVRHRPGRRGPLPPERPGHRGRPAQVRHRPGRDRHRRTAGGPTSPRAAA